MGLIWPIAAALWAIAEASVFFIVPDVLITTAVLRFGAKDGLKLAVIAAVFAAVTGLGMWLWGSRDAAAARHILLMIPAIGPDLLARAQRELGHGWFFHLVVGAVTGVPYKIYAVEAGARGISPWLFVPASMLARLARFSLAVGLTAAMREALARMGRLQWRTAVLALGWCAVYGTYFTLRANA